MFRQRDNKRNGFTLLILLIAGLIIAVIFGGFYLSKNSEELSTPEGQIKSLKKSEQDIDEINNTIEKRNINLEEN